MSSSILIHEADLEQLRADITADVVSGLRSVLAEISEPRLVDRPRMAELLSISVPSLDILVREKRVPSVLLGARRLFRPQAVIDSITPEAKKRGGGAHAN